MLMPWNPGVMPLLHFQNLMIWCSWVRKIAKSTVVYKRFYPHHSNVYQFSLIWTITSIEIRSSITSRSEIVPIELESVYDAHGEMRVIISEVLWNSWFRPHTSILEWIFLFFNKEMWFFGSLSHSMNINSGKSFLIGLNTVLSIHIKMCVFFFLCSALNFSFNLQAENPMNIHIL